MFFHSFEDGEGILKRDGKGFMGTDNSMVIGAGKRGGGSIRGYGGINGEEDMT